MSPSSTDIFWSLRPIYFVSRILGFAPFTIEGPTRMRSVKYSKTYDIVCRFFRVVFVALAFYSSSSSMQVSSTFVGTNKFLGATYKVTGIVMALSVVSEEICSIIYSKTVVLLWERLYCADKKLCSLRVELDYSTIRTQSILVMLPDVCIIVGTYIGISTEIQFNSKDTFRIMFKDVCFLIGTLNHMAVTGSYVTIAIVIKEILKQIKICLVCNSSSGSSNSLKHQRRIAQCHHIYLQLCQVGRHRATVIYKPDASLSSYSYYFIFQGIYKTIQFVPISDSCFTEMKRVKNALIKASASKNILVKRKANSFALNLLHEELEMKAGNCIEMNYTLIFSMLGAVSSCLFILIQFDVLYNLEFSSDFLKTII